LFLNIEGFRFKKELGREGLTRGMFEQSFHLRLLGRVRRPSTKEAFLGSKKFSPECFWLVATKHLTILAGPLLLLVGLMGGP